MDKLVCGKKFANLYQSMPALEQMRGSVFQYMKTKGGNIIAVVDAKKGSVKQYIQEIQSDTKLVGLSAKGGFVSDSLRVHLQKDKMNYEDFVWFMLSEEDKTTDRSIRYWFKVIDLDDNNIITPHEMEYFYEEQVHRLEYLNHEPIIFVDLLC